MLLIMFFSWFPLLFMGGSLSSLINTVLTQTSCFLGNAFVGRPFPCYKQTWFQSLLCLGKASLTVLSSAGEPEPVCSAQHSWKEALVDMKDTQVLTVSLPAQMGPQCFTVPSPRNSQAWLARGRSTCNKNCRLAHAQSASEMVLC